MTQIATNNQSWHLKLFEKSVLKQAKLKNLQKELGNTEGFRCLDLGSDNGVISYHLRKNGGDWHSADLSEETVSSIRSLVETQVSLIDGRSLPYEDEFFDIVVVVDMLEHVEDDSLFIAELVRILKPEGRIILNTPNIKPLSPLRGFRELVGQGDKEHGHLRPGYTDELVVDLSNNKLSVKTSWTYSRFFSEAIDTAIVLAYRILSSVKKGNKNEANSEEVSKGLVFTEEKLKSFEKSFKLYSKIYPIVKSVASLDSCIPFLPGYMRLVVLGKR